MLSSTTTDFRTKQLKWIRYLLNFARRLIFSNTFKSCNFQSGVLTRTWLGPKIPGRVFRLYHGLDRKFSTHQHSCFQFVSCNIYYFVSGHPVADQIQHRLQESADNEVRRIQCHRIFANHLSGLFILIWFSFLIWFSWQRFCKERTGLSRKFNRCIRPWRVSMKRAKRFLFISSLFFEKYQYEILDNTLLIQIRKQCSIQSITFPKNRYHFS